MSILAVSNLSDGLLVRNLRHLHPQVSAELTFDFFEGHVDLGIAQAGNQRFASIGVTAEVKCRVLLNDSAEGHGHLVQVVLRCWRHRHPEKPYRLINLGKAHRVVFCAESVSS